MSRKPSTAHGSDPGPPTVGPVRTILRREPARRCITAAFHSTTRSRRRRRGRRCSGVPCGRGPGSRRRPTQRPMRTWRCQVVPDPLLPVRRPGPLRSTARPPRAIDSRRSRGGRVRRVNLSALIQVTCQVGPPPGQVLEHSRQLASSPAWSVACVVTSRRAAAAVGSAVSLTTSGRGAGRLLHQSPRGDVDVHHRGDHGRHLGGAGYLDHAEHSLDVVALPPGFRRSR